MGGMLQRQSRMQSCGQFSGQKFGGLQHSIADFGLGTSPSLTAP